MSSHLNILEGGIFPKPLLWAGLWGAPVPILSFLPVHFLCPGAGWAALLQWVQSKIQVVVSQREDKLRARLCRWHPGSHPSCSPRIAGRQPEQAELPRLWWKPVGVTVLWQWTACCWLPLRPALALPAPAGGTKRERQMVPGRKRLAQLWPISLAPKLLLCLS